ncbi:hypothetical protein GY45DRAFT_332929 [Cubamyces sp. BRFM 1775]|nr:hypothetical protein GY45DRAFT_332929 [Cubamyces sp. BRFM 1775]
MVSDGILSSHRGQNGTLFQLPDGIPPCVGVCVNSTIDNKCSSLAFDQDLETCCQQAISSCVAGVPDCIDIDLSPIQNLASQICDAFGGSTMPNHPDVNPTSTGLPVTATSYGSSLGSTAEPSPSPTPSAPVHAESGAPSTGPGKIPDTSISDPSGGFSQTSTESGRSRGVTSTTFTTLVGQASTTSSSKPAAQPHSAHPPIAAIASVVVVLFLALLGALYLYVRRVRRRRASDQSANLQKDDDGPGSSREPSAQRVLDKVTEAPLTSAPHQDVYTSDRAAAYADDRPLLRHSTSMASFSSTSPSVLTSSTGEVVDYRAVSETSTHTTPDNNFAPRPMLHDSWGSDGDSDDPGRMMTETERSSAGYGWHPSRMVRLPRPPSSLTGAYTAGPRQGGSMASSERARRGDSASCTYESGETGRAL